MATKTNKSFTKRLRVTRRGKILARRGGRNHFNAKEGRGSQLASRRNFDFPMNNKDAGRFLPNLVK